MLRHIAYPSAVGLCVMLAGTANGQVVDGQVQPGEYATLLAAQTTGTGFGNNISELNTMHGTMPPNRTIRLGLTGNLEGNGNTIVILFDTHISGCVQSTLPGGYGVIGEIGGQCTDDWGTNTDGSGQQQQPTPGGGSILPPGFNPEVAITVSLSGTTYYINRIDLTVPNSPAFPTRDVYFGSNEVTENGGTAVTMSDGTSTVSGEITSAFTAWTNTQGVNGLGKQPGDPLTSTMGLELFLTNSVVGASSGRVKIVAFITNGGGDYLSNQFLPGLGVEIENPGAATPERPLFDARLYPAFAVATLDTGCYPNCDGSTNAPVLNVLDFACFLNAFASGASYANCDGSSNAPVLNVLDFSCFLNEFSAGCLP